jgi:hypothetical protein
MPLNSSIVTTVLIAAKRKSRQRLIGDSDPDEWDLPPKPKWMRWRTYNRYVERFDRYEEILERGVAELMAKFFTE